jgi:molybdopterin synthase catalytic subunit
MVDKPELANSSSKWGLAGADTLANLKVQLRLFAGLRDRAGTDSVELLLVPGSTVQDAVTAAAGVVPGELKISGRQVMYAINREYVTPDTPLRDGDELALIPPVSGGAPFHTGLPDEFQNVLITEEPLDAEPLVRYVTTEVDGAVVTFLGITRDHNDGRTVEYLEYEAYRPMADEQIHVIMDEMQQKWQLGRIAVAHRTGRVDIGETSMVVAVGAAHRRPAFEAALYFVDRLKEVVPIWKKETFEGGEVWIGETPGANPGLSDNK